MRLESVSPLTTNSSSCIFMFNNPALLEMFKHPKATGFSRTTLNTEKDLWNFILKNISLSKPYSFSDSNTVHCFTEAYDKEYLHTGNDDLIHRLFPNWSDAKTVFQILEEHLRNNLTVETTVERLINTKLCAKNNVVFPIYYLSGWDWDTEWTDAEEAEMRQYITMSHYSLPCWECSKEDVTPKELLVLTRAAIKNAEERLIAGPIRATRIAEYIIQACGGWNKPILSIFLSKKMLDEHYNFDYGLFTDYTLYTGAAFSGTENYLDQNTYYLYGLDPDKCI